MPNPALTVAYVSDSTGTLEPDFVAAKPGDACLQDRVGQIYSYNYRHYLYK
jgi:hypothetical protein